MMIALSLILFGTGYLTGRTVARKAMKKKIEKLSSDQRKQLRDMLIGSRDRD
jgi:uncharacterized protein YneF (UPF0154 family)